MSATTVDERIRCQVCGDESPWDEFDIAGACDGNVFCNGCNSEIDQDGKPAKRCGKCRICEEIKLALPKEMQPLLFGGES